MLRSALLAPTGRPLQLTSAGYSCYSFSLLTSRPHSRLFRRVPVASQSIRTLWKLQRAIQTSLFQGVRQEAPTPTYGILRPLQSWFATDLTVLVNFQHQIESTSRLHFLGSQHLTSNQSPKSQYIVWRRAGWYIVHGIYTSSGEL